MWIITQKSKNFRCIKIENIDFINEAEIYEPIENSDLKKLVPQDERIWYSAIFTIIKMEKSSKKWSSHVILTEKKIVFTMSEFIPIEDYGGIRVGNFYVVPWYAIYKPKNNPSRFAIGNYHFLIKKDKSLASIKPFKIRVKELKERTNILIKKSKEEAYERLVPILRSYPKSKIPLHNPSNIPMIGMVFKELKSRYLKQQAREITQGTYRDREVIPPIPNDTYYDRDKIIEEVRNYNFEYGTYDQVIKVEEMAIVFTNFFGQHSLKESIDLISELIEINAVFVLKWYKLTLFKIKQKFPKREKEFFEFEKLVVVNSALKSDEHLVADFKGTVSLPKAHWEALGHIYITNYRLVLPDTPKGVTLYSGGLISGAIASGIKSHIIKAREELKKVILQNPDIFYIRNPYNINFEQGMIQFTMNFNYKEKFDSEPKNYKLDISINIQKYKKEDKSDYIQRKKDIILKVKNLFISIPKTVCPKCYHVQDKTLEKCEKCGKSIKFKF